MNTTPTPHQIPGYAGFVPGHLGLSGHTYSKGTHEAMKGWGLAGVIDKKACAGPCHSTDPCSVSYLLTC